MVLRKDKVTSMEVWQLQTAKARLGELVKKAATQGPQMITVRGEAEAVVLSKFEYDRMIKPKPTLFEFIRNSPLAGVDLDLSRDKSETREDTEL